MRFKSITRSNYFPVKAWMKDLVLGYITAKGEEKILGTWNSTIYSEVEIIENPHHHITVQGIEWRKLQDTSFVLQDITIWEHLLYFKETDLSDPGQSRIHIVFLSREYVDETEMGRTGPVYINRNANGER